MYEFWWVGTSIYGLAVLISNLKMVIMSNTWNLAHIIGILGSLLVYLFTLLVVMTWERSALWNIVQVYFVKF